MREIRVTGRGLMKVHPDMTRITMTLEGLNTDYGETLRQSAEDTEELKDILAPFGFERTDLKTLSFDVDTKYESYEERRQGRTEYKRRFVGYEFTHVLKLEFESDNQRLGMILYALAHCRLRPEFRLSYTVKDPEAVKNELLGKAVQDAMAKAGVLSSAAGLRLGEIRIMDYSWGRIDFEFQPMDKMMMPEGALEDGCLMEKSCQIDIEPDDIEVQDTVTMVWEIA